MAEFQVRSDAVDVEQIMRQIRARIREKRGADYTEQEIIELASVKLEKFLDPRGVRSNLVEEFRRNRVVSAAPPSVVVEPLTITGTHRSMLSSIRKLLSPIMKLFINPVAIMHDINTAVQKISTTQQVINEDYHRRFRLREEMDPLYYEVIHNLVVELTRLSIENNNLKMRVESLSSRMDFDERRARALESVVQYKPAPKPGHIERPQAERPQSDRQQGERAQNDRSQADKPQGDKPQAAAAQADPQRAGLEPRDQGERGERRRRRRRRRRPGQNLAGAAAGSEAGGAGGDQSVQNQFEGGQDDGPDDDGPDDMGNDTQTPPEGSQE
ncbi:MAG: hypothetical protein KA205_07915 [Acidobacteria bacterium]|nr:hypothetical protein [Acidobacteriota bacterium]